MFQTTKKSLLAIALTAGLAASAQNLPEPMVLAARKAVASNPEVQARWHAFKAAREEQSAARAGFLPQLDLSAFTGRHQRVTPAVDYGTYGTNGVQLTLTQMLFDGFFTSSEVKRLGFAGLMRYYELSDISQSIALDAMGAYVDLARSHELVDAATQNFIEHSQTATLIEERTSGGVSRRVDMEQATGRVAQAESKLMTERIRLHDAGARYLRIVGEQPPLELPPLSEPFKLEGMPASFDDLMRGGFQNSPLLNAAVENKRSFAQAVESKKAAFMPGVVAQAFQKDNVNLMGVPGNARDAEVAAILNYNLYRGGADSARERQAVSLREQSTDLQEKACRDVRQTLAVTYNDVQKLNLQLLQLSQHRLSTDKARAAYRQQFEIGQRTLLDLLNTQNEYFEAARSHIDARYNQAQAQARTLAAMGKLVAVLGVDRNDVLSAQDAGQNRSGIEVSELCPPDEISVEDIEKFKASLVRQPPKRPGSYVVLLASPDSSVGRVIVRGQHGEQSLSKVQQGVALDGSSPPFEVSKDQLLRDFGAAQAALPAQPEQFILYFKRGSVELTPESRALLPRLLERVRARQVPDLSIVGHTDTMGGDGANDALGRKRAEALVKQMRQFGLKAEVLTVTSNGKRTPLVATPDETDEPRNRRVEITLR